MISTVLTVFLPIRYRYRYKLYLYILYLFIYLLFQYINKVTR
nr:MAG TPA: hypothetical protein [Caudoviricetes sp.]